MRRLILIDRELRRFAISLTGLLVLVTISAMQARAQDAGRVFALLAIDTDSRVAGVEDDGRAMQAILANGFGNTGILSLRVFYWTRRSPGRHRRLFPERTRRAQRCAAFLLQRPRGHVRRAGARFDDVAREPVTRHPPYRTDRTTSTIERAVDGLLHSLVKRRTTTAGAAPGHRSLASRRSCAACSFNIGGSWI